MNNPNVSVIVPCHNREDTVVEAIDSVFTQDYENLEVIAVDDASTDGTLDVLRQIDDPRLRVTENPGKNGVSAARNHGVALSNAPWIAFQDSDDVWLPGKLSAQMARLEDSDYVAAYCRMLIKADTKPDTPVQGSVPDPDIAPLDGYILESLTRHSYISTQMLVLRRDVFDRVGGFDEDLPALVDWELMLRVAQEGPVAFIDSDLVVQRMSDNSITNSSRKRLGAQEYILEKHHDLLTGYPASLAFHHNRIAGGHRIFGNWRDAARHARLAVRAAPNSLKYRLYAAYLNIRAAVS